MPRVTAKSTSAVRPASTRPAAGKPAAAPAPEKARKRLPKAIEPVTAAPKRTTGKRRSAGSALPNSRDAERPAPTRRAPTQGDPPTTRKPPQAAAKPRTRIAATADGEQAPAAELAAQAIAQLRRLATSATRAGFARYAIPAERAFGVAMKDIQTLAKQLGRRHDLAAALWDSGWYEARMLACYVDDPRAVTPAQMEYWSSDFDSWAICDTVCFALFSHTPHAWNKAEQWRHRHEEFIKRAAFALLASLVLRDKQATDARFVRGLQWIEIAAADERNFVKKSVNWALRTIGKRSTALNTSALATARRLAAATAAAPRWVGKDAVRELSSSAVVQRLAARAAR